MDQETKNYITASIQIAKQERPDLGDEESAVLSEEIFNDAKKNFPDTDLGKKVKQLAFEIGAVQATGMASPYVQQPKFDYEKLRDETSIPAIVDILKKLSEHSEFLPIPSKPTPDYEKASDEGYSKLMLDTFQILNARKIGMSEYKYIFDSLKTIMSALEEGVMQQVTGHRHEIMSRIFGTKNPGTEKFDSNYATYEDLTKTLERVRTETGGKMEDYFNINPSVKPVE